MCKFITENELKGAISVLCYCVDSFISLQTSHLRSVSLSLFLLWHFSLCSLRLSLSLSCCLPCIPQQVPACCAAQWRIPTGCSHLTVSHISRYGNFHSMYRFIISSRVQFAQWVLVVQHVGLKKTDIMQVSRQIVKASLHTHTQKNTSTDSLSYYSLKGYYASLSL